MFPFQAVIPGNISNGVEQKTVILGVSSNYSAILVYLEEAVLSQFNSQYVSPVMPLTDWGISSSASLDLNSWNRLVPFSQFKSLILTGTFLLWILLCVVQRVCINFLSPNEWGYLHKYLFLFMYTCVSIGMLCTSQNIVCASSLLLSGTSEHYQVCYKKMFNSY